MTDIAKLKKEISLPAYQGMTDDEILLSLKEPAIPIPPATPPRDKYSKEEELQLGDVSPADIKEAKGMKP